MVGRALRWLPLVAASAASAEPASDEARGEAVVGVGTNSTHHAAIAHYDHATDDSVARAWARWHDEEQTDGVEDRLREQRNASLGVSWTLHGRTGRADLDAFAEDTRLHAERSTAAFTLPAHAFGGRARFAARTLRALDLDHELGIGAGLVQLASDPSDEPGADMQHMKTPARTLHAEHRVLQGYIHDTIRVIESLDVDVGFVFERWRWLSNYKMHGDDAMEPAQTDPGEMLIAPRFSALYRVDDRLALRADRYRALRPPTLGELYETVPIGGRVIAGNVELRPEAITTLELGAQLTTRELEARTTVFSTTIDAPITAVALADGSYQRANTEPSRSTGFDAALSWQPAQAVRATVAYTFTQGELAPRHRASAAVTFDDPRLFTLTGAVRYVDRQVHDDEHAVVTGAYTVIDAIAVRELTGGLSGFVSVANLMNRRYVENLGGIATLGAPRMIAVGLRVDTAKF